MKARVVALVVLAVVAVTLVWNMLFFAPAGRDVDAARRRRDDAVAQQQRLAAELRTLQSIGSQGPAWRAKIARLNAMVPRTPELDAFIRSAYNLKSASGVDWVSIQPAEPSVPKSGSGPTEIAMQIVVNGGYFQVLDYLDRLEQLRRIVVIDSVDIAAGAASATPGAASSSSSSGAPQLAVTLAARMFTQAPAVVADGTAPATSSATSTPSSTSSTVAGSTSASTAVPG